MGVMQKIVEHLGAIDCGKVSVAELHVARIVPRGQKGSQDNRFKVRLHHPLQAKLLGDSIQFIELEALAAPRVRQCFERHVEADFVPESKTVRNRTREAVDPNCLSLDAILLDAKVEHGRRDVDYSKRRRRKAWHTRAPRDGEPDFIRKLRPDVVEPKRRDEADDGMRKGSGRDDQVVVLCRECCLGQPIASRANLLEHTRAGHPRECAGVNALMSHIPSPQDGPLLSKAEKAAGGGASTLRLFAYTH
jgi:hypothetical protein